MLAWFGAVLLGALIPLFPKGIPVLIFCVLLMYTALRPIRMVPWLIAVTPFYNAFVIKLQGLADLRILEPLWLVVGIGMLLSNLKQKNHHQNKQENQVPLWFRLLLLSIVLWDFIGASISSIGPHSYVDATQTMYLALVSFLVAMIVGRMGADVQKSILIKSGICITLAVIWSLIQMILPALAFPEVILNIPGGLEISQVATKTQMASNGVRIDRLSLLDIGPVAGATLLVAVFALTVVWLENKRRDSGISLGGVLFLALISLGLVLTFSRTAWILLVGVVLLVAYKRGVGSAFWATTLGMAVLAVLLRIPQVLARFSEIGDASEGSFSSHLKLWALALSLLRRRPVFGWGPGSFKVIMQSAGIGGSAWTTDAHNYFLQAGAEGGIIGMLLAMSISIGVMIWGWNKSEFPSASFGIVLAYTVVLFMCLTMNAFRTEILWIPMGLCIGLNLKRSTALEV